MSAAAEARLARMQKGYREEEKEQARQEEEAIVQRTCKTPSRS